MPVSDTFKQLDRRKQTRIVTAALTEFAQRGYSGTSINSIVERAGIAKGSIFNYFKDKQGLFRFVCDQALELVKDHLRRVRDESGSEDVYTRIEKSLLAGAAFIGRQPRMYGLYMRLQYDTTIPGRAEILKSVRAQSIGYWEELLATARQRGEISGRVDLAQAAFAVDAVLERFVEAYGVRHFDAGLGVFKADRETTTRWVRGLVDLLRHGLTDGDGER